MADGSRSVIEALDRLRNVIIPSGPSDSLEYPQIAEGPVEHVLAFNNYEFIVLKGPDEHHTAGPYFSSHGPLTDLQGHVLQGSKVATTFPVDPATLPETIAWPPEQREPFDIPPVDNSHTTGHGYSKQAYYFDNDENWFVTVGPSLPKILRTTNGGAQFWVGSIGVIAQGGGRYAGARGVATYVGSAYFDVWPNSQDEQIQLLQAGFRALVGTYVKVVLGENVARENVARPAPARRPVAGR